MNSGHFHPLVSRPRNSSIFSEYQASHFQTEVCHARTPVSRSMGAKASLASQPLKPSAVWWKRAWTISSKL
jgi:hypothetical protein